MTEISGYKAPRRPRYLFLTNDWTAQGIYENFREYEQDFRDIAEDVEIDESYCVVGERNGRIDVDDFQELAYAGDIDLVIGDMELEAEGVEGEITYETGLPMEGPGRIKASFEVDDPELEDDVERFVDRHFDSFLGLDLGYNPLRERF